MTKTFIFSVVMVACFNLGMCQGARADVEEPAQGNVVDPIAGALLWQDAYKLEVDEEIDPHHWSLAALDHFFEKYGFISELYLQSREETPTASYMAAMCSTIVLLPENDFAKTKLTRAEGALLEALLLEYADELRRGALQIGTPPAHGPGSIEELGRRWPLVWGNEASP